MPQLCVGTENGSIGLLDIATHKYSTVLRSHTDSVNSLAVDGQGKHLVTASSDGTIRIWNLATHQQLYALLCGVTCSFPRFLSGCLIISRCHMQV